MHKSNSTIEIRENVPLAPHTTLGVGGPARFFTSAENEDQLQAALKFARSVDCPVFILGGGSNIVVADEGFPGIAVKIAMPGIRILDVGKENCILAGAGVEWDSFVYYCVEKGLAGIECLSGIPGTVGGVPIQNVGAYGQEAGEVISNVRVWDRKVDGAAELNSTDCGFSYRSSIFNTTQTDRYIILGVSFVLDPNGSGCIRYPDLQRHFSCSRSAPTIRQVREAVLQIREAKSMVCRQEDPYSKSVGSFFRNPILRLKSVREMEESLKSAGMLTSSETIPCFDMLNGRAKLPAAWFIERAGFHKGFVHGSTGISKNHSLAIINRGGCTAKEIVAFMRLIQQRVQRIFGINLEPEPRFVGFDSAFL